MAAYPADDAALVGLSEAEQNDKPPSAESVNQPSLKYKHADGTEIPTDEDMMAPYTLPFCAYIIAYVELAERFSYYGMHTGSTVTNFIQQPLPVGSGTGAGSANGQSISRQATRHEHSDILNLPSWAEHPEWVNTPRQASQYSTASGPTYLRSSGATSQTPTPGASTPSGPSSPSNSLSVS